MNTKMRSVRLILMGMMAILAFACNFLAQVPSFLEQKSEMGEESSQTPSTTSLPVRAPSEQEEPTAVGDQQGKPKPIPPEGSMALIRQWASEAVASSAYSAENWAAFQATGEPNTAECGDHGSAWAAAESNTSQWIVLYYPQPVYAVEVNIYQTYNPDQVVSVDLIDLQGNFVNVYTAEPRKVETCPFILSIPTASSGVLAQGVRININQSVLRLGWNEIDAVEIVGAPGEGTPTRPILP